MSNVFFWLTKIGSEKKVYVPSVQKSGRWIFIINVSLNDKNITIMQIFRQVFQKRIC